MATVVLSGALLLLLGAAAAAAFVLGHLRSNQMPVDGKMVLVTGGSEGMGLSVSCQLAAKGANVVVVARNPRKLQDAVGLLEAAARDPEAQRFGHIVADVAEPGYAESVVAEATRWNGGKPPDVVWCVAGRASTGLWVDDGSVAAGRRDMDVNFWGSAEMAHAVMRRWLHRSAPRSADARHLVFTSSVVAFYTVAGYAAYAPSKAAIRALADTLAQEALLYPQKVRIHVVYPGSIRTAGLEKENETKPEITRILEEDDPLQSPDDVARRAIRGLEQGQNFVTVAWLGHLMKWGAMGGSARNNWVVDTMLQMLLPLMWLVAYPVINGKVRAYAKKHGHPDRGAPGAAT